MPVTHVRLSYKNLHQIFEAYLVQEHQIERVLFRAGNLHEKNLAASRYDRHATFLYELTLQVSCTCVTVIILENIASLDTVRA